MVWSLAVSSEYTFRVGPLGFESHERQILRSVLAISECRTPTFKAFVQGEMTHPHVVIVNADCPDAMSGWETFCQRGTSGRHTIPIYVSRAPMTDKAAYTLSRPIIAVQLFELLEQVVAENHGFQPSLAFIPHDALIVLSPHDRSVRRSAAECMPADGTPTADNLEPVLPSVKKEITALVIDDSLPVQMQMLSALHPIAAHIDFADSASRALQLLETNCYSVVFLDVVLPDLDSYELCQRIKGHSRHKNTAVVMLAGRTAPADRVRGSAVGCNAYLITPVRQATFEHVVEEFLRETVTV